ncbi:MAG: C-terminal binding protein [Chloroflexia bacterium]
MARWQGAGDRPGRLGVGFAGWSNTGRVGESLSALDPNLVAMSLTDENGHVPDELRKVDVLVSGGQVLNGPIYDQLSCRMILRPYVGYNDINVPEASERGILVCNVPDAYSEEVAMQAIAFLMAANRQLFAFDRETREGRWRDTMGREPLLIHNSRAQTVGVVGFGRIGRIAGTRAKALGFRVIASDPYVDERVGAELGIPLVSLDEVLEESDYLLIHAFLWSETEHIINAARIAQMKAGAWLINTARGPIVDEAALICGALRSGHLAGAGLDVMEIEPIEMDNPLLTMSNVMLSPHMAVYSEEGQQRAGAARGEHRAGGALGAVARRGADDRQGVVPGVDRGWGEGERGGGAGELIRCGVFKVQGSKVGWGVLSPRGWGGRGVFVFGKSPVVRRQSSGGMRTHPRRLRAAPPLPRGRGGGEVESGWGWHRLVAHMSRPLPAAGGDPPPMRERVGR